MDPSVTETYMGEWKNDKRSGYGISERTDGLKYEGEWYANKKYGYGVTTFANGEKEEGKYKNNVLITSQKKKLFLVRSAKFRERIDAAVNAAQRASKIALQKSDIAINRSATARGKAEQADLAAAHAREDCDVADTVAKKFAPDFKQPGLEKFKARQPKYREQMPIQNQSIDFENKPTLNQPNQILANKQNQIPNMSNQITNPSSNQIFSSSANQSHLTNQIGLKPPNQNPYFHQQPPQHNDPSVFQNKPMNPYPNPILNNPYSNPANPPGSHRVEFAETPHLVNSMNDNPGNEFAAPRNSVTADESVQPVNTIRRMSRRVSGDRPYLGSIGQQTSIDYFDHYKRPPSRDSSVDRLVEMYKVFAISI